MLFRLAHDELSSALAVAVSQKDERTWRQALKHFHEQARQSTSSVIGTYRVRNDLVGLAKYLEEEEVLAATLYAEQQRSLRQNVGRRMDKILGFRRRRALPSTVQIRPQQESAKKFLGEDLVSVQTYDDLAYDREIITGLKALKPQITVWGHQYFETCRQRQEFAGRPCPVPFTRYYDDPTPMLITAGVDGFVKIWDPMTLKLRASLKRHFADITSLEYYTMDSILVTGDRLGHVKVWRIEGFRWVPVATVVNDSRIIFLQRERHTLDENHTSSDTRTLDLLLIGTHTGHFCVCDLSRVLDRPADAPLGSVCDDAKLFQVRGFPSSDSRVSSMGAHLCDIHPTHIKHQISFSLNVWMAINQILASDATPPDPPPGGTDDARSAQRRRQMRRVQFSADMENDSLSLQEAHRRKKLQFRRGIDLSVTRQAELKRPPQLRKVAQPADFELLWPQKDSQEVCMCHYQVILDLTHMLPIDARGLLQVLQTADDSEHQCFGARLFDINNTLIGVTDTGFVHLWHFHGEEVKAQGGHIPTPLRLSAAHQGNGSPQSGTSGGGVSPQMVPQRPSRILSSSLLASLGSHSALTHPESKAVSDTTSRNKGHRTLCAVGATAVSRTHFFFSEAKITGTRSKRQVLNGVAQISGMSVLDPQTQQVIRACFYDRRLTSLISFIEPHPALEYICFLGTYGGSLLVYDWSRDLILWTHEARGVEWLSGQWINKGLEVVASHQYGCVSLFGPFRGDVNHASFTLSDRLGDGPSRNLVSYCFPLNPRFGFTPLVQFMNLDFTPVIEVWRESMNVAETQDLARRGVGADRVGPHTYWGFLYEPHYSRQPHEVVQELQIVAADRSAHAPDLPPQRNQSASLDKQKARLMSLERVGAFRMCVDRYFATEDASLRVCTPIPKTRPPLFPQFVPASRGGPTLVWPQPPSSQTPSSPLLLAEGDVNDGEQDGEQEGDVDFVASSSSSSSSSDDDEDLSEQRTVRSRRQLTRRNQTRLSPQALTTRSGRTLYNASSDVSNDLSSDNQISSDSDEEDDINEDSDSDDTPLLRSDLADEAPSSSVSQAEEDEISSIALPQEVIQAIIDWNQEISSQHFEDWPFEHVSDVWTLSTLKQRLAASLLLLAPCLESTIDREDAFSQLPRWIFESRPVDIAEGCHQWLQAKLPGFDAELWTTARLSESLFEDDTHQPLNYTDIKAECLLCGKGGVFDNTTQHAVSKPLMESFEEFYARGHLLELVAQAHGPRRRRRSTTLPAFLELLVTNLLACHTTDHIAGDDRSEVDDVTRLVGLFKAEGSPFYLHHGCLESLAPHQGVIPSFSSGPFTSLTKSDMSLLLRQKTSRVLRDQASRFFNVCTKCQIHTAHLKCLFCKKYYHWLCALQDATSLSDSWLSVPEPWTIMKPGDLFRRRGVIVCDGCLRNHWWPLMMTGGNSVDASVEEIDVPRIGSKVHFCDQAARGVRLINVPGDFNAVCINVKYFLQDYMCNAQELATALEKSSLNVSLSASPGGQALSTNLVASLTLEQARVFFTTRKQACCSFVVLPPHPSAGTVVSFSAPDYTIAYITDRHAALHPLYNPLKKLVTQPLLRRGSAAELWSPVLARRELLDTQSLSLEETLRIFDDSPSPSRARRRYLLSPIEFTKDQFLLTLRVLGTLIVRPSQPDKVSRALATALSGEGNDDFNDYIVAMFDSQNPSYKKCRDQLAGLCGTESFFSAFCSSLEAPPDSLLARLSGSPRKPTDVTENPLPSVFPSWRQAYVSLIPRPVTLFTIFEALKSGRYMHKIQLKYDMLMLRANCHVFNTPSSPLGRLSSEVQELFDAMCSAPPFTCEATGTVSQAIQSEFNYSIISLEWCLQSQGVLTSTEARALLQTRCFPDENAVRHRRRRRKTVIGTDDENAAGDDPPVGKRPRHLS